MGGPAFRRSITRSTNPYATGPARLEVGDVRADRRGVDGGIPMAEVAQYLGHTDSRVTERVYARFGPDYLRRAALALNPGRVRLPE